MQKRKLIEVALPLEAINRESAREKSIRHGHPSTIHLWWARRPLAAARAVLFAQLVDDPSSRPDEFPTEDLQRSERERLHGLIRDLVDWDKIRDRRLLAAARREIQRSTGGAPPPILDPFAGGGAIPLEAQRLGLAAHASDLNPVAVLINKALIEIPATFRDQAPIYPGLADSQIRAWKGAEGLAADVRAYGAWVRDEVALVIGPLYPKATLHGGAKADVISWIWTRTVPCPNPACRIDMPLVRSWWLGTKKGREAYVIATPVPDRDRASGMRVSFRVGRDLSQAPPGEGGTVGRTGAQCVACKTAVPLSYIRAEGRAGRMKFELMAVVAEGDRQRVYLDPSAEHIAAANVARPDDAPLGELPTNPRDFKTPNYGMRTWADLFTNRQLVALTTFATQIGKAHDRVIADGGTKEYADAIVTYLGLALSKAADMNNSVTTWKPSMDQAINLFKRQAIPMVWNFPETPPLSDRHAGGYLTSLAGIAKVLDGLQPEPGAKATQADAATRSYDGFLVSTDPPYYDNIGYSDLSDFFYVWLRRTLRPIYPDLFSTVLVPKAEELVANAYRHNGRDGARDFFEEGFRSVFARARAVARDDYPITVWYAFKQSETDDDGEASTGWQTLLEGMIRSGWEITSTWPMRSELSNRMLASGTNALASAIVLSLRPRESSAPTIDRRGFIAALEAELPDALRKLQQGLIAPVDLPQAAIGPGMAVFSRYGAVLEDDGSRMSVRSALARINEILDQVLNEQEGDFDPTTRFAIQWYRQHGYGIGAFGDADNLARARNTSVEALDRDEVLVSRAGKVHLVRPADLALDYDPVTDAHTSNWEALHHLIKALQRDGIASAGVFLGRALARPDRAVDADLVKELGHLLFRISETNGWTKDALSFNEIVTSWPDIMDVARGENSRRASTGSQAAFSFEEDE